ncbi:CotH kinase family protein [Bacteroidia bacterium]|nr:CotH kinase family protein [Bacteroidia bacterium]
MKLRSLLLVILLKSVSSFAQTDFYANDNIREVKFYFSQSNWDDLLDSFYIQGDENRLMASISIDGSPYDSVGIRYKGYSSVSIDRKKNPFNVKLDWVKDQSYRGVDKLKLSNVIQDPSFLREAMSYEIARKYMPASKANYVKLFINDEYWGVYTNVQSVNKAFLRTHFGSAELPFLKANPQSLDLSGENCNLGNSPGTDSTNYYKLYELKSDYGYSALYELIDVLNNNPDSIERVLNIDRTLWMHAFNYVLINFDSYIGYAQNYYLYQDHNGRFNPILWDLNQSFASYRLADASIYYNGFSIEQAKTIDPLLHHNNVSVYPRPLLRNLFKNDGYRKMYLAHIRTIIEENFANQWYKRRAQTLQNLIDEDVKNDSFKFYSYQDFKDNLNSTVTDLVDYPGIIDLMDDRTSYMQSYPGYKKGPSIETPSYTVSGNDLFINARVTNGQVVTLAYRNNSLGLFEKVPMLDDGMSNDGAPNDGLFGALLQNKTANLEYYIYAENDSAGQFSPERAAYEYYIMDGSIDLVINEVAASNKTIIADNQGDYDDWIELYNNTATEVSLKGYYLSDNSAEQKWIFPDVRIPANGYLLVWADKDTMSDGLHANFKLSSSGEGIFLWDTSKLLIDNISFGQQTEDRTIGRSPNGTGSFFAMKATPWEFNESVHNDSTTDKSLDATIYPNPTDGIITLSVNKFIGLHLHIYDLKGRLLLEQDISSKKSSLDVSFLKSGMYLIYLFDDDTRTTKKLSIH